MNIPINIIDNRCQTVTERLPNSKECLDTYYISKRKKSFIANGILKSSQKINNLNLGAHAHNFVNEF